MPSAKARRIFALFDTDGSGTISGAEVTAALRAAHGGSDESTMPTEAEMAKLMARYDTDHSSELDLNEFSEMVAHMTEQAAKGRAGRPGGGEVIAGKTGGGLSALETDVLQSAMVLLRRSETGKVAMMSVQALRTIVPIGVAFALIAAAAAVAHPSSSGRLQPSAVGATLLNLSHACCAVSLLVYIAIVVAHCRKGSGLRDARNQLIVSICAMVPLYAVASNVKLHLRGAPHAFSRQLLDAAKECYEAVVLYDFLELMCVNLSRNSFRVCIRYY